MHVAVVSTRHTSLLARLTVRRAASVLRHERIHVLDVDGTYMPTADERVTAAETVGINSEALHRLAAVHLPHEVVRRLHSRLVRTILAADPQSTVLALQPGVLLLTVPTDVLAAAAKGGAGLIVRSPCVTAPDGSWPSETDVGRAGVYAPQMIAVSRPQDVLLDHWEAAADRVGERWLDLAACRVTHHDVREEVALLSPWNLTASHRIEAMDGTAGRLSLDGREVQALDLSRWDPEVPWLLDSGCSTSPRARLSDHPDLATFVRGVSAELDHEATPKEITGTWDLMTTSLGTLVDEPLRHLYRASAARGQSTPDPFDPEHSAELLAWLTAPSQHGGPGRYLEAIHRTRPDLHTAFPQVPGHDTDRFLAWARTHGTSEYSVALIEPAFAGFHSPIVRTTNRRVHPGVNVIGYLRGELGIGESARLMIAALETAQIPHASVAVDRHLASRQNASARGVTGDPPIFDTSLICVNADLTPSVAATLPDVVDRSYRIGMWYWEVENFPDSQHGGFDHVDEVWVATDFIRRAIEPHSPVPVRTITPPLPQRGPDPTLTRTDLGLPDRPIFLFSFDFLSTAERKNPLGLIDAFTEAFSPAEGPVLVIKSINADQRPSEAERLRLRAASAPDVILIENYLDAVERDALVALCDCYVSLHRSEGLGLTMAEAMAWGKPVIATGYSGNLQFMTEQNSYLVPWEPAQIPPGAEPYPAGGIWAEPDLHAAARMMRLVMEDPESAAARGARAASDIATLHSAEVAGRAITARLEETKSRRRARSRLTLADRVRSTARRLLG